MRGSCFARTPRRPYGHWGERDKTPPRFPDDSAPRNKFNASIGAESQENKMSQLTDARILNESIVDVADQHTILDHIGKKVAIRGKKTRSNSRPAQRKSPVAPLPFETQKSYCNLLARMDGKAIAYSDVHGSDGTVLARLRPAYVKDKFWLRLVPRTDIKRFPSFSWGRLLPIQGTLMKKVTFVPNPNWPQKFSPVPRVLLYPFGWSTSLSVMVSRPHSIHDLADFLEHLFTGACLLVEGADVGGRILCGRSRGKHACGTNSGQRGSGDGGQTDHLQRSYDLNS